MHNTGPIFYEQYSQNNQKRRKRLTFRRFFCSTIMGILLVVNGNCVFNFLQWAEERKVKVFQNGERVVCGSKGVAWWKRSRH